MASGVSDGALIIDTKLDNSGTIKGAREMERAVNGLETSVNNAGKQMAKGANGYVQALGKAGSAAKSATANQQALEREIAKTAAALARMEEKLELQRRKFEASKEDAIAAATEKVRAGMENAEFLPWENEAQALEQLSEDINQAAQQAAESFGAFEDTTAFRNTSVDIEFLEEKLAELNAQLPGAAQGIENVAAAGSASGGMAALGSSLSTAAGGFVKLAGSALRAGASVAKMAGGAALSFLRKLAAEAKNAAIQLAKLAGSAIAKGFKGLGGLLARAGGAMLGFRKQSDGASGGLKQGLMAVLKYGLGIRGLFALFRRLRSAVSDGLGEIAKRSPEVNRSLNMMRGALNALKGSLATAFAPVVTAVAPALTRLINMLASAINTIGAFIAALTGQKTYQVAVAGLNATGSAASGASGAVKELNRQLGKFDDLDVLKESDSGGGGGGGGGGAGSGLTYTTAEISGGITDFVAKLKELWANADYEGIGREIAGAINGAFAKAKDLISWDSLGAKITEAVDAITGIFNGLVDGVNWTLIGETFGEGINTIIRTANQLLTKVDWTNLGVKLAEGLNGLVSAVDWTALGDTFKNRLKAVTDAISGFVSTVNWAQLGYNLAAAINEVFSLDWDYVSRTITNSIDGVLTSISSAIDGLNWAQIGYMFASGINGIFGINWDNVSNTITKALTGALDAIENAVDGVNWAQIGYAFASGVNSIINLNWDHVGSVLAKALNGALTVIGETIGNIKWAQIGYDFASSLNALFRDINWGYVGTTLSNLIGGPLKALKDAVTNFDFGEAGTALATTVNGFFSNAELWSDAATTVSEALKGLFTWGTEFLNNLDTAQIATDIKTFLKDVDWAGIAKTVWDLFVAAFNAIGSLMVELLFGNIDTSEFVHEGEDAFNEVLNSLGMEPITVDLRFGLDINNPQEQEWYNELNQAIQDSLREGEWIVPIDPSIPPEAVDQAYSEFVYQWNKLHPKAPITAPVKLGKDGWTTLAAFVGNIGTKVFALGKSGWTTIANFVGNIGSKAFGLGKSGWTTIANFVGNIGTKKFALGKDGWSTISNFVGKVAPVAVQLNKGWGKKNPLAVLGIANLKTWIEANLKVGKQNKVSVKSGGSTSWTLQAKELGGILANGFWRSIPRYAGGTLRAGSIFAAGEAGPELVGHIGGRTEVLNKSQLAATMYSAVTAGMLRAMQSVAFRMPAVAGSVMPYEVSAQIAKAGEDIRQTLDANNEDLIQTIISVAAQIVAAMNSRPVQQSARSVTPQQVIDEINRRTQMFGVSPLMGV